MLDEIDAEIDAALAQVPGEKFVYYEPMCGSLSVGLHVIEKYQPALSVIADVSCDIINFFVVLQGHYEAFLRVVRSATAQGIDEDTYYALRDRYNAQADDPVTAAAHFYLLNRACFNGVYRVNGSGRYNVPFGKFRGGGGVCYIQPENYAQLHRAHHLLTASKVVFMCTDVLDFLKRTHLDYPAIVYCDPPYVGTDRSLYHPHVHFSEAKHEQLAGALGSLPDSTHVLLSNSNCEAVRRLYLGWRVRPVHTKRTVSCSVESRGDGFHDVLITRGATQGD